MQYIVCVYNGYTMDLEWLMKLLLGYNECHIAEIV